MGNRSSFGCFDGSPGGAKVSADAQSGFSACYFSLLFLLSIFRPCLAAARIGGREIEVLPPEFEVGDGRRRRRQAQREPLFSFAGQSVFVDSFLFRFSISRPCTFSISRPCLTVARIGGREIEVLPPEFEVGDGRRRRRQAQQEPLFSLWAVFADC